MVENTPKKLKFRKCSPPYLYMKIAYEKKVFEKLDERMITEKVGKPFRSLKEKQSHTNKKRSILEFLKGSKKTMKFLNPYTATCVS